MTRSRRLPASVVLAIVVLGAVATTGCVAVPIRMRTRVEAPAGTKQVLSRNDFVPGKTTREDVEGRYGAAVVWNDVPGLFWGRFRKSSWAFAAVTALPTPCATGGRLGGIRNLIVTFDEYGSVRDSFIIDEGDLHRPLMQALAEVPAPPREWGQPLRIRGRDPYAVEVVLKFRSKTSVGDHLKFPVDSPDTLTIARWWAQVKPRKMQASASRPKG
jgi:hypothetical protein